MNQEGLLHLQPPGTTSTSCSDTLCTPMAPGARPHALLGVWICPSRSAFFQRILPLGTSYLHTGGLTANSVAHSFQLPTKAD